MDINYIFSRENAVKDVAGMSFSGYIYNKYNMLNMKNIYHYTDVTGFLSIMQNREFWLSHIRFMNDKKEFLEGKNICESTIDNISTRHLEPQKELLEEIKNCLQNDISTGVFARSSKDVFSISFSHNRDSLDMWRGYGNNSGIAIGFDFAQCSSIPGFSMMRKEQYEHELKKHNNNPEQMVPSHEIRLFGTNVIYDKEQKKELISEVLNMGLEHFNFMQSHSPSTSMISARNYLTDSLFSLFPFIKNEAFKNEEECRVVENYARSTGEVPLNVYYRQRNGISLPYIRYALLDINCRPIKQWPISEIVIGPGLRQYDLAESIKYFLSQQGMQDLSEKVVLSEIPFVASI